MTPGVPGVSPSAFPPGWSFGDYFYFHFSDVLTVSPVKRLLLTIVLERFLNIIMITCSSAGVPSLDRHLKACPCTPIPSRSLIVDVAMKTLPNLDRKYPGTPATLVCLSCYFRIPLTSASHGTVSSKMSTIFREVDHMTRSGLRLVVRISNGKNNLWSRSTCILQCRAASKRIVSILADGFAGSCPALMNKVVFGGPGTGGGRALLILPERLPVLLGPGCVSRCSGLGTNGF